MDDFHVRLNDAIHSSGFTLDEISRKSGVSTKTIQNWTRKAKPTMPRLNQGVMVAQILGESAEYLVTGKAPRGLSEKGLKVALAAENLNDEGKEIALGQVEALMKRFPQQTVKEQNSAG